jgi:hypothetical protein
MRSMTEDIKENAMSGGTPTRLRGLAANGNSISPTVKEVANAMNINQFIKLLDKGNNIEVKAYYAIFNIADATTAGYMFGVFANKVIPLSKSNDYSTTKDNPDTVNIYRKDEWTLVIQNNASNRTIRATIISSIT